MDPKSESNGYGPLEGDEPTGNEEFEEKRDRGKLTVEEMVDL